MEPFSAYITFWRCYCCWSGVELSNILKSSIDFYLDCSFLAKIKTNYLMSFSMKSISSLLIFDFSDYSSLEYIRSKNLTGEKCWLIQATSDYW